MRTSKRVKGGHGSTLLEVMIACLIMMVIAVAGGAYVSQSRGLLAAHRNRLIAMDKAKSRLEELRATPYSELTNLVSGASTVSWTGAG